MLLIGVVEKAEEEKKKARYSVHEDIVTKVTAYLREYYSDDQIENHVLYGSHEAPVGEMDVFRQNNLSGILNFHYYEIKSNGCKHCVDRADEQLLRFQDYLLRNHSALLFSYVGWLAYAQKKFIVITPRVRYKSNEDWTQSIIHR